MALVATYGNVNAYNVKVYDLSGGGYYAVLCDGATEVFQRRGKSGDTRTKVGSTTANYIDRFTSYSYTASDATLTLSGSSDTNTDVVFSRWLTFRFLGDYVVEDTLYISTDRSGGSVNFTNWNYYNATADRIYNLDNSNFGTNTSTTNLGLGVRFASDGPVYGCIADNGFVNKNNVKKRSVTSSEAIAVTWVPPDDASYVPISTGSPMELRQYFFKSTLQMKDFMLQSQLAICEAKGYTGTTFEKVLKATAYLNIAAQNNGTTYHLQPSNYYPRMYVRDSFWHSFGVADDIEQQVMQTFDASQNTSTGKMPTSINRDGTSNTSNDDEGALLHLIRGWYDQERRGLTVSQTVMQRCLNYILSKVTNDEYRVAVETFTMWNDNYKFTVGSYSGYTQGLYCMAMKCAIKLGLAGATSAKLSEAITKYQALYDDTNKYIKYGSDTTDMGPDVLVGEALNIYMFGEKFLTDEIVSNHLERLITRANGIAGMKIVSDLNGGYLSTSKFLDSSAQGDYQNGGSWLLYESLAYYAGIYHGHARSYSLMKRRQVIEFYDDIVAHEYIGTLKSLQTYLTENPDRHVYSWNAALLAMCPPVRRPAGTRRVR